MRVDLLAPLSGRVVPLDEVPDAVFAERMAGDGVAIEPEAGPGGGPVTVLAPCDGRLAVLFPGAHALAIVTPSGLEVIVHIGLDTVDLAGEGFEALARQGDEVRTGTPLVRVDFDVVRGRGRRALSPVVIAGPGAVESLAVTTLTTVEAGRDTLLTVATKR